MTDDLELDSTKLPYHPDRVLDWFELGIVGTWPMLVELSPTNVCNQKCCFCAFDYRRGNLRLDADTLKHLAWQWRGMPENRVYAVHVAGEGEPLLGEDLEEFCSELGSYVDMALTTNGSQAEVRDLLKFMTWVRFSVNAATPETYRLVHGVDQLQHVLDTIGMCLEDRKELPNRPTIGMQYVVIPQNRDEVIRAAETAISLGVDYVSFKPFSRHPEQASHAQPIDLDPETIGRLATMSQNGTRVIYREHAFRDRAPGKSYSGCLAAPFFAFLASDGGVYPCSQFVGDPEWELGNVRLQTWVEICESDRRRRILGELESEYDCSHCRTSCRLDASNRYLYRLLNPEPHDWFL